MRSKLSLGLWVRFGGLTIVGIVCVILLVLQFVVGSPKKPKVILVTGNHCHIYRLETQGKMIQAYIKCGSSSEEMYTVSIINHYEVIGIRQLEPDELPEGVRTIRVSYQEKVTVTDSAPESREPDYPAVSDDLRARYEAKKDIAMERLELAKENQEWTEALVNLHEGIARDIQRVQEWEESKKKNVTPPELEEHFIDRGAFSAYYNSD